MTAITEHTMLLRSLWSENRGCHDCTLRSRCNGAVPGRGNYRASVMLVGEAPGQREDETAKPFQGAAGQYLNKLLAESDLVREDFWITNVVKCLDGATPVLLADGTHHPVRHLVREQYAGEVVTVAADGTLTTGRVTGWYRTPLGERRVYRLRLRHGYRHGVTRLTEEHPVLTPDGWCRADQLQTGVLVASGEPAPGPRTRSFITGMLLGDATLSKRALSAAHGEHQAAWAELKAQLLAPFSPKLGWSKTTVHDVTHNVRRFHTKGAGYWKALHERFYPEGRKVVPADLVLDDYALAAWFADDGSMRFRPGRRPRAEFAANGFTEAETQRLAKLLAEQGLEASARSGRIFLGLGSTIELSQRIAHLLPPELDYKLLPEHRGRFDPSEYAPEPPQTFWDEATIEPIPPRNNGRYTRNPYYCIDVADTHNFVTPGGVVHNCRPSDSNATPTQGYIDTCAPRWLEVEIDLLQPDVVVAMGATAIRYFLGRETKVDDVHGMPFYPEEHGHPYTVFATYHPAAALNQPQQIGDVEYDFRMLGKYLAGESVREVDEIGEDAVYAWVEDVEGELPLLPEHAAADLWDMMALGGVVDDPAVWRRHDTIAVDYELNPPYRQYGMFCFSLCLEPGVAFAFAPTAGNLRMLKRIAGDKRLAKVYHNLIGVDYQTQQRYGIKLRNYTDTMVGAYWLNWKPQGLKPLAMRHLGMSMIEYNDIAAAARRTKALEYLRGIVTWPDGWPDPPPITELKWDNKRGHVVEHTKKPQNIVRKAQYRIDKAAELGTAYDPWRKWYELEEAERAVVEEVFGPMSDAGLAEVADLEGEEGWAKVTWYSARDADATLRLWLKEERALRRDRLLRGMQEVDLPTLPLAVHIMEQGMYVNADYMRSLSDEWEPDLRALLDQLAEDAGRRFNPNSPKQVAELLYNPPTMTGRCTCGHDQGLHTATTTRKKGRGKKAAEETAEGLCAVSACKCMAFVQETGGLALPLIKKKPSTEADVLKELEKRTGHPVLKGIIAYRHLSKLNGTYAKKLPKLLDAEGRVHAAVKVTRTATGRWASGQQDEYDPIWNSQNIPIRDAESLRIRSGFEAPPGWVLVEVDLSQIEMRVAAYLSNDRAMIEAFTSGHDFHTATAAKVAGIPVEELERDLEADELSPEHIQAAGMRRLAKVVNFGIIYGLCLTPGHKVLTDDLRWVPVETLKEGDGLLAFDEYPDGAGKHRKWKRGRVVQSVPGEAEVCEIALSNGQVITATPEHPWLIRRPNAKGAWSATDWVQTQALRAGDKIGKLLPTWEEDQTREGGWLAGFMDGEASWTQVESQDAQGSEHQHTQLTMVQNMGETLEYAERLLAERGFKTHTHAHSAGSERIKHLVVNGGLGEKLRALGSLRPQRLLNKLDPDHLGSVYFREDSPTVVSVENKGVQPIVRLTTDAKTYVAEGLASHNTAEGLAAGTGLSLREAEAFINAYFKTFRGLELWLRQQEAFVKNYGYVESPLSGRRRYIPEVRHPNKYVVEAGVREARNMPIQGMAQDVLKLAEGQVLDAFGDWGVEDDVRVVNQIHDSLILEIRQEVWRDVAEGIRWLMETATDLGPIPIKADIKAGWRWGEMIEMKGASFDERFNRLMDEREESQQAA